MKSEKLSDALEFLPDDLIEKAAEGCIGYEKSKKIPHRISKGAVTSLLTAASIMVVTGISLFLAMGSSLYQTADEAGSVLPENGTEAWDDFTKEELDENIPEAAEDYSTSPIGPARDELESVEVENIDELPLSQVTIPESFISPYSDANAALVYNDRVYAESGWYISEELLGEYIGRVTDKFSVGYRSERSGLIEYGNFFGEVYEINGFSPDFSLCAIRENGRMQVFVNDNDITLKSGGDLFFKRLNIGNYTDELTVKVDSMTYPMSGENLNLLDELFAAMEGAGMISEKHASRHRHSECCCTLCFTVSNEFVIEIRLFDDGCVQVVSDTKLGGICAVIDNKSLEKFINGLNF